MEGTKINWHALLKSGEYRDEYTAQRKGAKILMNRLTGGFFRNTPRTKKEILEIITSIGITDNPEEVFKTICDSGIVLFESSSGDDYLTETNKFRLQEIKDSKGDARYVVNTYSKISH